MPHRVLRSRRCVVMLSTLMVVACGSPSHEVEAPAAAHTVAVAPKLANETKEIRETDKFVAPTWDHGESPVPVTAQDPSWGDPLAPVTMVVFMDFECPFATRLYSSLESLKEQYGPMRLRIVFKHKPLPFHKNAHSAAVASNAVFRAGGPEAFWRFADAAFSNQKALTPDNFHSWALRAGVDAREYEDALHQSSTEQKVEQDLALSERLGVRGTPHSFVNGTSINGAQPLPKFREAIGAELVHVQFLIQQGIPAERVSLFGTSGAGARRIGIEVSRPSEDRVAQLAAAFPSKRATRRRIGDGGVSSEGQHRVLGLS